MTSPTASSREKRKIVFFWDVDNTVTTKDGPEILFEEYSDDVARFLKQQGITHEQPKDFFKYADRMVEEQGGERGVTFPQIVVWQAQNGGVFSGLTNKHLEELGHKIPPAIGLCEGLTALQDQFAQHAIIHHYFISLGFAPMIRGFIEENHLEKIVAGVASTDFYTNDAGVITGLKQVVKPEDKVLWIRAVVKGGLDNVHKPLRPGEKVYDYHRMVTCGDGFSDIAMFAFTKFRGGISTCLYVPGDRENYRVVEDMDTWARYILPRDYTPGGPTHAMLCEIVDNLLRQQCLWTPQTIYDYFNYSVRHPAQAASIQAHLNNCPECQALCTTTYVTPYEDGVIHRKKLSAEGMADVLRRASELFGVDDSQD